MLDFNRAGLGLEAPFAAPKKYSCYFTVGEINGGSIVGASRGKALSGVRRQAFQKVQTHVTWKRVILVPNSAKKIQAETRLHQVDAVTWSAS